MPDFEISLRLKKFPPYLFAEIDKEKIRLKNRGVNLIDLGIGDPDIPAPSEAVKALYKSARIKENQKYALDKGKVSFRRKTASWLKKRFRVNIDPEKEVLPLLGSKEGLVHFSLAFVNKSDYIIIPSPAYPAYRSAALFSQANIFTLPLREKNKFIPDLGEIPSSVKNKAKLMYLNYPNNPTTAVCPRQELEKIVKFCAKYGIILAYDNAYSEIYFEKKPLSVLEIKGAKEVSLEFHSFSKTFCMTGFRIAFACGNKNLISGLEKVKTNIDSGVFRAVQESAIAALEVYSKYTNNLRRIFKERRNIFIKGLKEIGYRDIYAAATFYVWAKIPKGFKNSIEFSRYLLNKKNIVATPGIGFGKEGEGFIRFALTVDKKILKKALERLG